MNTDYLLSAACILGPLLFIAAGMAIQSLRHERRRRKARRAITTAPSMLGLKYWQLDPHHEQIPYNN